jgi:hypothetical protein
MAFLITPISFQHRDDDLGWVRSFSSSRVYAAPSGPIGSAISPNSQTTFSKSNQSKVFFHDGTWWAIALEAVESDWYIWKFEAATSTWNMATLVNTSSSYQIDAVLEAAANRLHLILSHKSKPKFQRLTYSNGTWSLDVGFPVSLNDFPNSDGLNPLSLVQAKNGELWLFRVAGNNLQAKRSTTGGATWSAAITLKSGLTTASGVTDAAAFSAATGDYVGVAYGETAAAGSKFGVLLHHDGDSETTWTDESAGLTFSGSERATNEISLTADDAGRLFLLTQNVGATGANPNNTLYRRDTNGAWQAFSVNPAGNGINWKHPAIAVDDNNNVLYLLGINVANGQGEYKSCQIGDEATLAAAAVTTLFATGNPPPDGFTDLSVPAASNFTGATSLVVCVDNPPAKDIWYNQIPFAPSGGGQSPMTVQSVTPSPDEANATAGYTIALTLGSEGALTAGTGTISVQFPDNTFVPNSIAANQVLVNGIASSFVNANNVSREVTVTTPIDLANAASVTLVFEAAAGLLNPSQTGNKTLSVWTSVESTPVTSPSYAITSATTTVSSASVTPIPTSNSTAAAYTIALNLGAHGRLISGSSTITVTFNSATGVSNGNLSGVQVNGVNASATGNNGNKTITITVPASLNLGNGAAVTINLPSSAITNPASAGDYTLTVATSVETAAVTSNSYTIDAVLPVNVGNIILSTTEANVTSSYTVPLTLGNNGALTAGNGTITIQFPDNTFVPSSIAANQITVDGVAATTVASNSATRQVTVTTPVDLSNNANVSVIFDAGADILNPSAAGDYSLQAWTSAQLSAASSPLYSISAALTSVSVANVTPNPNTPGSAAGYTIIFNLGGHGRLISGSSTITVTFNSSTGVSNGNLSGVQINGVNANATGNNGNKTITITVPASLNLGNGAAVTVNVPSSALINPSSAGDYTLAVATSVENTAVTSNSYTIEALSPVGVGNITLSTNEANATSSYTVPLTLGNNGALTSGNGTITIQFPDNTFVPNSIAANQITVNGVAATTVASNSATRQVTVTTPVDLPNNSNVSVVLNAGANLLNPSAAGNYNLQVWTSAQPLIATSPVYSITAASTSVSAANVTPNPNTPGSAAAYTITLNLGGHGRLISGSSTITVTFNSATGVSNGNLSGVQVNGVNANATGDNSNKTITITVPASLNLGNGAAMTINLPSSALTNPASAGSYTLTVATSVETIPTASNFYSIESTPPPPPPPATGVDNPITGSSYGYDKPHQNRPFYHGGYWWTAARKSSDGFWYLWKLNGSSWSAILQIDSKASTRPDCYVDSPANKLYILAATTSSAGSKILRLSYSGGSWSLDSGFPVTLSSFNFGGERGHVLTKAKNGDLWVFRYESSTVQARRSSNGGSTWSSNVTVKGGLVTTGLFDAVAFTSGGQNYVGVGYAENTASNAIYGFLRHKDGDPDGSWTDETGAMPQFANATGDDHMCLTVSQINEIFFICKTHPDANSAAGIGLFKRSSGGNWQNFTIQQGGGWTRPAVVVDETNNELYVLGTQEGSPDHGQYKKCAIGNESSLLNAEIVEIFDNGAFNNLSVPGHRVTGATGLLVCAENESASEIWYNLLPISGGGSTPTPLAVNAVTVNPNTTSQIASYSISLTLGSNGALNSGSGTMTVTWPNGTTIPATIANSAVTVNGSNAANVTTTPASRRAVVTVPNNLANNASVSLVFTGSAGIVNPATAGSYTLAVQTSAQPTDVTSPGYAIQAPVPVTVSNITVNPNTTSQIASYTIPFTLGSSGALSGGSGTITVTWPNDTNVPATIANAAVTVNGSSAPPGGVTTTPASRQAVVTVPNNLANSASVTLVFTSSAGITNPTAAGNYPLNVQTSAQPVNAASPNYTINAPVTPPVTVSNVTVAPDTVSRTAAYTIPITLGNNGALTGGSGTITVTWPNNTTVPATISTSAVTINNANAATVVTNSASRQAIVTVPANLANNANITLVFTQNAGIVNPTAAGNYTLAVQTSAQPVNANSPAYNLKALPAPPSANSGSLTTANTGSTLDKSNQSKLFYHLQAWWMVAYDDVDGDWYLWKFQNGTWTRDYMMDSRSGVRIDVVLDSTNDRLYYVSSQSSTTKFGRLRYSSGTWVKDVSLLSLSGFGDGGGNPVSMARAANGELWLSRVNGSVLEAKLSSDNGATWSSNIVLKSGLDGSGGVTDGLYFAQQGLHHVGVFYGMTAANGGNSYGFLSHRDGDPSTAWTDESGALTFFGSERADEWVSAQAANDGTIFVLTHNSNAAATGAVKNTLYRRPATGGWSKFKVNTGVEWTSPAVGIDESNQRVYLMGVRTDSPNIAEHKSCSFGDESTLEAQIPATLFKNGSDNFSAITAPCKPVYNTSGLLVGGGNLTTDDVWYNLINLGLSKFTHENKPSVSLTEENQRGGVSVYPNPFNPITTIRFTLQEAAPVSLQIFNIRGELVKTLVGRELGAGTHERRWNGRDGFGHAVASGTYFYRLRLGGEKVYSGRMEMVK